MASGKSTIGKLLSKHFQIRFIDLDQYIVEAEGMSIPEIFDQKGEIYFRRQETFYLKEVLDLNESFVLSLGGGTPCYGNNMELINASNSVSIYLKASIPTITGRIIAGKHKRPLVAHLSDEDIPEFIGKHLFERQYFYNQSQEVVTTDNKTTIEVVNEILNVLA